jgi:TolB-like protein
MFKLQHALKALTLCLATFFCAGLAAQDIQIAVFEPNGARDVRQQFSAVRNVFIQTITNTKGFRVMDRARTDQIVSEHNFARTSGLVSPSEARELGKMLGVDLILSTDLTKHPDELEVSCQVLDIVTGEVVGAGTESIDLPTSTREIREKSQDLMEDLLKNLNRKLSAGLNRAPSGGASGSASGNTAKSMLSGLEEEIARAIKNYRGNALWNRKKTGYTVEVDLSGVNIRENRQHGSAVHIVSGTVAVTFINSESLDEVGKDLKIEQFTEMGKELVQKKIMGQVEPKISSLVKELLFDID